MTQHSTTSPSLVWFRNDLRISDNPALLAAKREGGPAIAVYVNGGDGRPLGAASRWWLHHSLERLSSQLDAIGVPLVLASGDPRTVIPALAGRSGAGSAFWNRRYGEMEVAADREIKETLKTSGIKVRSFNATLLREPWTVKAGSGSSYRVFTPFWRAIREGGEPECPFPVPDRFPRPATVPEGERLDDWDLLPTRPNWAAKFEKNWRPGEAGASERLSTFLDEAICGYSDGRDRPDLVGTSGLSPHLRFGEISPRAVWHAVRARVLRSDVGEADGDKLLSELGWREFCYHLYFHEADLAGNNVQPKFDDFPWTEPDDRLIAWRQGRTGYPLVDAGMRQLWETGWMHNRVRMVVASFLTKHLRIDWRHGERWFWDTLVDADPASNPANWQWVAGSGADAAPYFRIFNPVLQGEKFDPAGDYVRRWVPELAGLPAKWIHKPWLAPAEVLQGSGVSLGDTYHSPIVDHATSRRDALDAFRSLAPERDTAA